MSKLTRHPAIARRRFLATAGVVALLNVSLPIPLHAATPDTILTIHRPDGTAITYSLAQLDGLPQTTIHTSTPWYDKAHDFSGPKLSDVLGAAQVTGKSITATALNDYAADLPLSDATDFGVILATRFDGQAMSIRDKGPIFIIYPYDADPKLQHDVYYGRSVWQVDQLDVK